MTSQTLYAHTVLSIFLISLVFLLDHSLVAPPLYAQTTDTINTNDEDSSVADNVRRHTVRDLASSTKSRIEAIRDEHASRTDAVRDKISDIRSRFSDVAQGRIQRLTNNLVERMTAAIEHLYNVADRIESHIEKIEDEHNIDAEESLLLIDKARDALRSAEIILEGITSDVDSALDSETPREEYSAIRAEIKEASAQIRKAHRLLRESVATLKELLRAADVVRGVGNAVRNNQSDTSEPQDDEDLIEE